MTREECIARYRAEELRSRTGATVTMLSKLKDAKYREEYGLYLAEGVKLTEEALGCEKAEPEMLFVSEDGLHHSGSLCRAIPGPFWISMNSTAQLIPPKTWSQKSLFPG